MRHFKLSGKSFAAAEKEPRRCIIDALRKHVTSTNTEVYLCDDGDVYVVVPALFGKAARDSIKVVASALHAPPTKEFADYFELPINGNVLLVQLEEKIEKRRKTGEILRKKSEQEQVEQKRALILHGNTLRQNGETIAMRRKEHQKPQVMIIEDDPFSRRLVENVLGGQFSLTVLSDADHALATYVSRAPNVLFLDIDLPNVSGQEILEKIIAIDPEAYVIMFSGNSDQHNIAQAMSHGAKGFVAKPFTSGKLLQYIERCPTIQKERAYVH